MTSSTVKLALAAVALLVFAFSWAGPQAPPVEEAPYTEAGSAVHSGTGAENEQPESTEPAVPVLGQATVQNVSELAGMTLSAEAAPHVNGSVANAFYAASLIDGTILEPGEIFSFNGTVGPRSIETGFVTGLSLNGQELVPDVGGGICRTATVLHWAVQEAGLKVLEQHHHTQTLPYAEPGTDAAVWWDVLDYRFQNNKPYPVQLATHEEGDRLIVIIYGPAQQEETGI